jgi:hypothetical protein
VGDTEKQERGEWANRVSKPTPHAD